MGGRPGSRASPRLLLLEEGAGEPLTVDMPGLDGRIKDVRVAADGVRIALVVEKDGKQSLFIGRIERGGKAGEAQAVSVRELRSAHTGDGGGHDHVVGR